MRWHHEAKDLLDYLFYECKSWADVDWRRIDDYVNSTWRGADGGEAGDCGKREEVEDAV